MPTQPPPEGLLTVLRQLNAETFVSGDELGQCLGVSRATIHNRLNGLADLGLVVQRVPGRGYRLAHPVSWLDAELLAASLGPAGFQVRLLDRVGSTNSLLLEWAQAGCEHRTLLATEWQTRGRGRRGRDWLAPLGGGLAFSLLWRFQQRPLAELGGLSLAVGVALARAVEDLAEAAPVGGLGLKWPNDVLCQGAKLAGILIEVQGDALGPATTVIGIGLNVHLSRTARASLDQPVTDLADLLGYTPDRNRVLTQVARRLDVTLGQFEAEGFAPLRQEWQSRNVHQGCPVRIAGYQTDVVGHVLGVDTDGALLLDTQAGVRRILSGEVSLRELPA